MPSARHTLASLFALLVVAASVGTVSCTVPGIPATAHFALEGAHRDIACGACHDSTGATVVPTTCIGCHVDVRPAKHDPRDCGGCHRPTTWGDVVVDHEPYLSLGGGHAGVPCADCHLPDTWQGLDAACESCHEPDRPQGHFAGPCSSCHTPSAWEDGEFDHRPFFPIPHRGVSTCTSCHPQPAGTSSFTCTNCHEHAKATTDEHHREVSRYRYESAACLECHPRGSE